MLDILTIRFINHQIELSQLVEEFRLQKTENNLWQSKINFEIESLKDLVMTMNRVVFKLSEIQEKEQKFLDQIKSSLIKMESQGNDHKVSMNDIENNMSKIRNDLTDINKYLESNFFIVQPKH